MINVSDILEGYWKLLTGQNREVMKTRAEICYNCGFLNRTFGTCGRCGCGIKAKASLDQEKCPEGKW